LRYGVAVIIHYHRLGRQVRHGDRESPGVGQNTRQRPSQVRCVYATSFPEKWYRIVTPPNRTSEK
jgi:hypothetical protein